MNINFDKIKEIKTNILNSMPFNKKPEKERQCTTEMEKRDNDSIEDKKVDDETFFILTYMAALATGDVDRKSLFYYTSQQTQYKISRYFDTAHILASKWGHEYSEAFRLIAKRIKTKRLEELFGRLSGALISGEPEKEFLKTELESRKTIYDNEYETSLEGLKKWTDGYSALLVSIALIITIILISTMIYQVGNIYQLSMMTLLMTFLICGIGIAFLYDSSPYETKTHDLKTQPKERIMANILKKTLLPLMVLIDAILIYINASWGYILIISAICMAPIGILGLLNDKKIDKRDENFSTFIKTLGSIAGTMGVTTAAALEELDKDNVDTLKPLVESLHASMTLGIDPNACWDKFVGKSGSELINRCVHIFTDGIELGGNPSEMGEIVSGTSLAIVLHRSKRKLISSGFTGLVAALHTVMAGLMIFIIEIMKIFANLVEDMTDHGLTDTSQSMNGMGATNSAITSGMCMFSIGEKIPFLYNFTTAATIILTLGNGIAIKVVEGGDNNKIFLYEAILAFVVGLEILLVPVIVSHVFTFDI